MIVILKITLNLLHFFEALSYGDYIQLIFIKHYGVWTIEVVDISSIYTVNKFIKIFCLFL